MGEIRIENLMHTLELDLEVLYKLSQARTPWEQSRFLGELKALVLMQKRKLLAKYAPAGVPIIGGGRGRIEAIKEAADLIHNLRLPPLPGTRPQDMRAERTK